MPKTGKELHHHGAERDFAAMLSKALVMELDGTHRAVKTVMRWTGASERCVKHWLAGTHAPSGAHLIQLMRHSDQVMYTVLLAAGREDLMVAIQLSAVRSKLVEVLTLIDQH
ncbi:MAG: hypothetical protein P0Y56_15550 [Candidatus Andeanibacterium colombiense]|uniref:Uncharacterized protein n=1 Tax=Candidatus Andeanibacterium colombiense TaxID=3121345 RepID=A0AAJ6BMF7_9SPHN|nr:MAG: hypothetical protein P0Y56_15550 [Sphingomonadaceae bacterium]